MKTQKQEKTKQEMINLYQEWGNAEGANFSFMTWNKLNEISAKYKGDFEFTELYICKTFLSKSHDEQQEIFYEQELELHAGAMLEFKKVVREEAESSIEKTLDMLRYLLNKFIEE